jgi:hypothetical protein
LFSLNVVNVLIYSSTHERIGNPQQNMKKKPQLCSLEVFNWYQKAYEEFLPLHRGDFMRQVDFSFFEPSKDDA